MELKGQKILIISTESWGDMWFSKHNWAYELSKNNDVYFVNSPEKWSLSSLFGSNIQVKEYTPSLKIVNYKSRIPFTRIEFIYRLNELIIMTSFKKWFKKEKIESPIFWSFDPYRLTNPKTLKPLVSIFFRVDKFFLNQRELQLLNNVDCLIVTAKELMVDSFQKKRLVLSHGISEEEFTPTKEEIMYEPGFFLYVGQIDHRIDLGLIEKMLTTFPNEKFVFIGKKMPIANVLFNQLFNDEKYDNLIVHGVEHFKKLKNYIYRAKACLVPMDLKIHGNSVHHHKSLQYLALGKPVISPIFNDEINKDEFISGYSNHEEAIERIKELALTETNEKIKNRITFAKQFLYSNLIKQVESFLD